MSSPSVAEHRAAAPESVACAVLTVSDTRTPDTDTSGQLIKQLLERAGHTIVAYQITPDDPERIDQEVRAGIEDRAIKAVLLNGGTGIAKRDSTYETIASLLDKRLDGFGELFRMLSFAEIGAAAMLSRAVAGLAGGTIIIAMPGSSNAVRLAMERLILPELNHLVFEANK